MDTGRPPTIGMFEEFTRKDAKTPPTTNLVKAKQLFIECGDPSEYEFAMALVGDWGAYEKLRNHPLLKRHVDNWVKEVEAKIRSEAIKRLIEHSSQPGGTAAAKWLATEAQKASKKAVGRPQKEVEEDHSVVETKLADIIQLVSNQK